MTLKEYARKIYLEMKRASTEEKVKLILENAIKNLETKDFSVKQIKEFINYLEEFSSYISEAQENEQTLKNNKIIMSLLSKKE